MVAAIVGYPHSGKRTLAAALVEMWPDLRLVDSSSLRELLTRSTSANAIAIQATTARGEIPSDQSFGQLLAEATVEGGPAALLVGFPRNYAEYHAFESAIRVPISLVALRASAGLVDRRRQSLGFGPLESEHPGSLSRIDASLSAIIAEASAKGRLLSLDADGAVIHLAKAAHSFLLSMG